MGDFDDIFPYCKPCDADWINGSCHVCGQKLADLIDNYDGAPYHAYDNESDSPTFKERLTIKQEF